MIDHFGIEIDPRARSLLLAAVPAILADGEHLAERQKIIDFTDMVYLPHRWQLQPPQLAWVFVDEAQDLNAAQLDLVLKCRAPGGRMLFVGDPQQAIYGFAGADSESFWKIKERTNAALLPLSICYRCPSSHLDLARAIVPQIEARPGAPAGIVEHITENQLTDQVTEGDMVLCRLTAPLVKLCIRFIERRISARVRGRDIGKQLTDIVRAVETMPGYRYDQFSAWLSSYESAQVGKLAQREGTESQIESIQDRVEAVRVSYQAFSAGNTEELCRQIEELFSDERPAVLLSTVHRAKGLENPRIFIVKPDKLPLTWPKQKPWEAQQEENLKYVALTKATEALYFVADS